MKTLNTDTYERIYSDEAYLGTEDYADLISLLVDEYERAYERFYKEFKLDKRKKQFGKDQQQKSLHQIALQIEVGLDASTRQFFARLLAPDQVFMNEKYFNKALIKPNEDKSSANSLKNKLTEIRTFIGEFQERHKLELRRSYRYRHGRLYYAPSKYLAFKQNSFPEALLEVLFKDFAINHDSYDLLEYIAVNYSELYLRKDIDDLSKLKKACEQINKRVYTKTNSKIKLILHNTKTTSLNPLAFDQIDRIQFDKNR